MATGKDGLLSSERTAQVRKTDDREILKAEFLRAHGFGDADRRLLAGDASTRRYERLRQPDGTSLIFMDQPPALESGVCPPGASDAS